jgi:hypothetical protein
MALSCSSDPIIGSIASENPVLGSCQLLTLGRSGYLHPNSLPLSIPPCPQKTKLAEIDSPKIIDQVDDAWLAKDQRFAQLSQKIAS